jgi:hypothetical protein
VPFMNCAISLKNQFLFWHFLLYSSFFAVRVSCQRKFKKWKRSIRSFKVNYVNKRFFFVFFFRVFYVPFDGSYRESSSITVNGKLIEALGGGVGRKLGDCGFFSRVT